MGLADAVLVAARGRAAVGRVIAAEWGQAGGSRQRIRDGLLRRHGPARAVAASRLVTTRTYSIRIIHHISFSYSESVERFDYYFSIENL